MKAIFATLVLVAVVAAQAYVAPQAYEKTGNQKLQEVATLLENAGNGVDQRHGLVHLLHASLHQNHPPKYVDGGFMVNELHPPVKVVVQRYTKARRIPHLDGETARRVTAGSVLVALATTPDMLWIQIGKDEFIPTRDARLEEPLNREKPQVAMLTTPLDIHVKSAVTVRKIPDLGGKPVSRLQAGDKLQAIGATPDYSWLMVGPNQFIPTISARVGDPVTPLLPPVTIHLRRNSVVRDAPSLQGRAVGTLRRGDIMQAVAVSSDLKWLKVAHGNYVATIDCKEGLPLPPVTMFPQPLVVKLVADADVVKNPNHPEDVIRTLKLGDELQAFGTTADLKWLVVAKKRFIPMETAQMKEVFPEPIPMTPSVPIKLAKSVEVRDVPDQRGHVMQIARKGDKYDAVAVSADFTWLKLGDKMWVPLTAAFFRKPAPETKPLVPPMRVTVTKDTKVYKTPDHYGKVVRTLGEGDTVVATAATPDLEWLKVGAKEYIVAEGAKLDASAATVPLFPALRVVVTKDAKVLKAPSRDALPVHRLKRGEALDIHETTADMKWLKIAENQYLATENVAHVAHTSPLTPAVRVVVAANLKVRNVPAFAGMPVRDMKKGETVEVTEVSPDFKWLKLAKDQYIPASGCTLDSSEGNDLLVVLKIRNSHVDKDPVVAQKATKQPNQSVTTTQAASMLSQALEKRIDAASAGNSTASAPAVALEKDVKQLRITKDTLVMEEPSATSAVVRGIKAGTLVNATGLGKDLEWLEIGQNQYVKLSATEPTAATTKTA